MKRIVNVVRLQFVNTQTFVWVPLIVLAGATLVSVLVFSLISTDFPMYGGGAQAPLWYFLVVGVQALTLTFPFSQAMSLTRREFYLGTLGAAALSNAGLATVFTIAGQIERVTDGFGTGGYTFWFPFLEGQGWWVGWISYLVLGMFFFVIGFWGATIYKRFGTLVTVVTMLGVVVLALLGLWLIIRLDAWASIGAWFTEQGTLGTAGWGALVVVVLAASSYLTLRRATP